MCGRYRLTRSQRQLEEHFDAYGEVELSPRYNIAPSQPVVTIRQDAREPVRKLATMRWGLIPSWAKDIGIGYKTINARAETVATTPSFRDPFKSQRCLICELCYDYHVTHSCLRKPVQNERDSLPTFRPTPTRAG